MKVVSTFAGCGGSSLGYKQTDCEVVAAVEWDDHAVQCYRLNHPSTRIYHGDIHKVTGAQILNDTGLDVGELDILDGSPPCQGFSTAGYRILDDPRNTLFQQHLRLIAELQPKHAVIENVSGMIKGQMRKVAAEIIHGLEGLGYTVCAGLMDAAYFGVGQRRRRVFFIASRIGQPSLPRPTTPPTACGPALADLDITGEYIPPTTALMKRLLARTAPGDSFEKALLRAGKKGGYFSRYVLHPDRPCFTFTKSSNDNYHWTKRLLCTKEKQVLTGFPADYQIPGSYSRQADRIGNAVAPPMTREIARQVLWPLHRGR